MALARSKLERTPCRRLLSSVRTAHPFRPVLLVLALQVLTSARADETPPAPPSFEFDQWLLAPVRVHLLQSTNIPAIHTTLQESDVERIVKKLNAIWSQAGISFWLESLVRETATTNTVPLGEPGDLGTLLDVRPAASRASNLLHLYYVKHLSVNGVYLGPAMFVQDSAKLRYVPGGIDEAVPRTTAHELGHALSLQHQDVLNRLMARGTTGTNLTPAEIQRARATAEQRPWVERAPTLVKRAESHPPSSTAARALYRQLAVIPLDAQEVRRAREQAAEPR